MGGGAANPTLARWNATASLNRCSGSQRVTVRRNGTTCEEFSLSPLHEHRHYYVDFARFLLGRNSVIGILRP